MKVFQGGIEIAGQMGLFSKGLSQLGHQVSAYNTFTSYLGYYQNIQNLTSYELQDIFQNTKSDYDVLHLHYAWPITENMQELKTLQEQGKVVLMHYWGNDVRTLAVAGRHNPYARLIGDAEYVDPSLIEQRLRAQSQVLPACIVQDFEVVPYVSEYFKRVYVLPVTVDLDGITPSGPGATTVPLVIHAPTLPEFKGTAIIEGVIDRLRNEGYVFRYERIHGLEHTEALRRYGEADILVDQILAGAYGVFALEGMALGRPVISYVREDLQHHFGPGLPIESASPATLYERLRGLLESPVRRQEVGSRGRPYVERVHSLPVVSRKLDWIYQQERLLAQANYSLDDRLPSIIDLFGMQISVQSQSSQQEEENEEQEESAEFSNVVPLRAKEKTTKNTKRRRTRKQKPSVKKVVPLASVRKLGAKRKMPGKPKTATRAKATPTKATPTRATPTRVKSQPHQGTPALTRAPRSAKAQMPGRRRVAGKGLRSGAKRNPASSRLMKGSQQGGKLTSRRARLGQRINVRARQRLTGSRGVLRKTGSNKKRA